MTRFEVKLGQKCQVCGKDNWLSYNGYLRCECGQVLWVKRYGEDRGTRFRYEQGHEAPKRYRGWSQETA